MADIHNLRRMACAVAKHENPRKRPRDPPTDPTMSGKSMTCMNNEAYTYVVCSMLNNSTLTSLDLVMVLVENHKDSTVSPSPFPFPSFLSKSKDNL